MTTTSLKRVAITLGEPAGIGPDLVLAIANDPWPQQLVVCGDKDMLAERAKQLGIDILFEDYNSRTPLKCHTPGMLVVCDIPLYDDVVPGKLNEANGQYVLDTLIRAAQGNIQGEFSAIVTGPVHKGVLNRAGFLFSGHTEFFAQLANVDQVVMMLATEGLRVALVTTHIPLRHVSQAITEERLFQVIRILRDDLIYKFNIPEPTIYVCGLNPHAGEDGYLGREEIDVIVPTLNRLRKEGINLVGPLPADTIFQDKYLKDADAVLAMYHDQGLPVIKFKGFGRSVNITLGLPFIRTSVDHGTALDLAGTGSADTGSLRTALSYALELLGQQA
ncbi:4-hydroxythreonine-4-phosphate dehydrogenase PdxA [Candidatus Enterovibrio escicola]|uniref:4-hydroxythreonine-4-phosphate dehydrogenase n=1 Tax=Candidatus Enterovibrio escicola TaxID=1927127 RepID=A0A2A5T1X2_9GAMM|nr:4-hydroxythreonine-4-phosphate dehydrogenase PdxA [Candidatus Enterovibrio escacola]PCS22130.1 4-hydroxythreonine-4-phosphate dehydrogenase [Candidatus Enterovibrio escacola]